MCRRVGFSRKQFFAGIGVPNGWRNRGTAYRRSANRRQIDPTEKICACVSNRSE